MENAEEIYHFLEEFSKRKPKTIPHELNEYLAYVARTGDPVYQWALVKSLFKEKLLSVITDFYETTPAVEIPPYPNVDPFNYDIMKNSLLERLDAFTSAPFTVQRICELLTNPRKQYNRVDKFMRAIEKNILVVSTREPGTQRHPEPENGESNDPIVNGSDNNSEYNVDVEMEDMSWKESVQQQQNSEPQPGSSESHMSVDDIEARLKAKQASTDTEDKIKTEYESVTPPPEPNLVLEESMDKPEESSSECVIEENKMETSAPVKAEEPKTDVEVLDENSSPALVIPEIKIEDAEMTEQRLLEQSTSTTKPEDTIPAEIESQNVDVKSGAESPQIATDESSSDSTSKDDPEPKLISEVSTSSEESSSSSDNIDGNSNSPKPDSQIDVQEESNQSDSNLENINQPEQLDENVSSDKSVNSPKVEMQSDNYSISDVNSVLPQPQPQSGDGDRHDAEDSNETNEKVTEVNENEKLEPVPENKES